MSTFLFDNGDSKVYDEQGRETHVYGMAVDNNQYSLEQFTTYDQYMDLKPPEKPVKIMEQEAEIPVSEDNSRIDLAVELINYNPALVLDQIIESLLRLKNLKSPKQPFMIL
ncbi:hypothetical protein F4703DRAFT_1931461 [Phycomyces blakesleeanus]